MIWKNHVTQLIRRVAFFLKLFISDVVLFSIYVENLKSYIFLNLEFFRNLQFFLFEFCIEKCFREVCTNYLYKFV